MSECETCGGDKSQSCTCLEGRYRAILEEVLEKMPLSFPEDLLEKIKAALAS